MAAKRRTLVTYITVVLLAACGFIIVSDWWSALPPGSVAVYVGRRQCIECHVEQYEQWTGSDHDLAMDAATPETVLADFDNRTLEHDGTISRMHRDGDRFLVTTEGPEGTIETFEVKYVFGVRPLQQYLVEFSDGRVQCLPLAWDTERRTWFHLYPDETFATDDWLHWTNGAQTWNYMCAECHTTELRKNYDLFTDTYSTRYNEIDVSCESCHGPGSIHVQLANTRSIFWDRRFGKGLAPLKSPDSHIQIDTCARCHSLRTNITEDFRPGDNLLDHYSLELIDNDLYHDDGQILGEVYVYGSFLQSKMYREGVRCTDCHNPHSTRLLAVGNKLCISCHVSADYDTPAHHFHQKDSVGSQCIACHAPETTYMIVDPRRDHSFRVPRPDLSVALGTPNVCTSCHEDHDAQWAADRIDDWYGPERNPDGDFAHALAGGKRGRVEAEAQLIAVTGRPQHGPMVRASAVSLLRQYAGRRSLAARSAALDDSEPLVRAAAVSSLEFASADMLRQRVAPLLADPIRLVRIEAARVLSSLGGVEQLPEGLRSSFNSALTQYIDSNRLNDDQPAAHLRMGVLYENLGDSGAAALEYQSAIRLDPLYVPAYHNLAMHHYDLGNPAEAQRVFADLLERLPDQADTHFSLGILLAESPDRLAEALAHLESAVRLEPDRSQYQYDLGLALAGMDRLDEAVAPLAAACDLQPESTEYHYGLLTVLVQLGRLTEALEQVDRLIELEPDNPTWQGLGATILRDSSDR